MSYKRIFNKTMVQRGLSVLLTTSMVVTGIHFSQVESYAKETFSGIDRICEKNNEENPFRIVEVVPQRDIPVTFNLDDGTEYGIDSGITISAGQLGYLLKGNENACIDANLSKLSSNEARKKFIEKIVTYNGDDNKEITDGILRNIISLKGDTAPLYGREYNEKYVFEDAEIEEEEWYKNGNYNRIKFNDINEAGEEEYHSDIATKKSAKLAPVKAEGNDDYGFIKYYYEEDESKRDTAAEEFRQLLDSSYDLDFKQESPDEEQNLDELTIEAEVFEASPEEEAREDEQPAEEPTYVEESNTDVIENESETNNETIVIDNGESLITEDIESSSLRSEDSEITENSNEQQEVVGDFRPLDEPTGNPENPDDDKPTKVPTIIDIEMKENSVGSFAVSINEVENEDSQEEDNKYDRPAAEFDPAFRLNTSRDEKNYNVAFGYIGKGYKAGYIISTHDKVELQRNDEGKITDDEAFVNSNPDIYQRYSDGSYEYIGKYNDVKESLVPTAEPEPTPETGGTGISPLSEDSDEDEPKAENPESVKESGEPGEMAVPYENDKPEGVILDNPEEQQSSGNENGESNGESYESSESESDEGSHEESHEDSHSEESGDSDDGDSGDGDSGDSGDGDSGDSGEESGEEASAYNVLKAESISVKLPRYAYLPLDNVIVLAEAEEEVETSLRSADEEREDRDSGSEKESENESEKESEKESDSADNSSDGEPEQPSNADAEEKQDNTIDNAANEENTEQTDINGEAQESDGNTSESVSDDSVNDMQEDVTDEVEGIIVEDPVQSFGVDGAVNSSVVGGAVLKSRSVLKSKRRTKEGEELEGDGFYTLTFEYREDISDPDTDVYSVAGWYKYTDGEESDYTYSLGVETGDHVYSDYPLVVPNLAVNGLITGTEQEKFIYECQERPENESLYYANVLFEDNEDSEDRYTLERVDIYYESPFINNEWFTRKILDRETNEAVPENMQPAEYLAAVPEIYYDYRVVTPNELSTVLSNEDNNVDLIYFSHPKNRLFDDEMAKLVNCEYRRDNDITVTDMMAILHAVGDKDENLPVIADYTLFDTFAENEYDAPNLSRLIKLLHFTDVRKFYTEVIEGVYKNEHSSDRDYKVTSKDYNAEDFERFYSDHSDNINTEYYGYNEQYSDKRDKGEKHYVNGNVYFYNYTDHLNLVNTDLNADQDGLVADFKKSVNKDGTEKGVDCFDEVWAEIANQNNKLRVKYNSNREMREFVNEAVAIKYILQFEHSGNTYIQTEINVLELQPVAVPEEKDKKVEGHLYVYDKGSDGIDRYQLKRICGKIDPESGARDKDDAEDKVIFSSSKEIFIDSMSTSEFVGHMDDVNAKYEMVYLGLATVNKYMENGRTKYNDSEMDGLVYTNIGDTMHGLFDISGIMDRDYEGDRKSGMLKRAQSVGDSSKETMQRYSGNDLTVQTLKALEGFIDGGYPFIADYNCYTTTETEGIKHLKVFDYTDDEESNDGLTNGYIDNCSKIYELLSYALYEYNVCDPLNEIGVKPDKDGGMQEKNNTNVFRLQKDGSLYDPNGLLEWYMKLPKPKLIVNSPSTEKLSFVDYNGGEPVLRVNFEIEDAMSSDYTGLYTARLYHDMNADGKYPESEVIMTEEGLSLGSHSISATISKAESGPIAWKLEVALENDGSLDERFINTRRDFKTGCVASRPNGAVSVNILQIIPNNNAVLDDHGTWDIEHRGDTNGTYQALGWNTAKAYEIQGYDISEYYNFKVHSLTTNQLLQEYANNSASENYIKKNYDVLIMGFASHYKILMDEPSYQNPQDYSDEDTMQLMERIYGDIENFIASNGSTLLGYGAIDWMHASRAQYPQIDSQTSAYHTTLLLRDLVGMDRFGASVGEQPKDIEYKNNYLGMFESGNIADSVKRGDFLRGLYDEVTAADTPVTKDNLMNKAIAYKPNSAEPKFIKENAEDEIRWRTENLNGAQLSSEPQGFASLVQSAQKRLSNPEKGNFTVNPETYETHSGEYRAKRMNTGQMTMFPYEMPEKLDVVQQTRYPFYSVDLDGSTDTEKIEEGIGDVSVWYASTAGNPYAVVDAGNARDLYYLYTKGNLVYLGMRIWSFDKMEAKVFVNALITAYTQGSKRLYAEPHFVKAGDNPEDEYAIYNYNDVSGGVVEGEQDLYFYVKGANIDKDAKIRVEFYREVERDKSSKLETDKAFNDAFTGQTFYAEKFVPDSVTVASDIGTADGSREGDDYLIDQSFQVNPLSGDGARTNIYKFTVNLPDVMKDKLVEKARIAIRVTPEVEPDDKEFLSTEDDTVSIIRTELFTLD